MQTFDKETLSAQLLHLLASTPAASRLFSRSADAINCTQVVLGNCTLLTYCMKATEEYFFKSYILLSQLHSTFMLQCWNSLVSKKLKTVNSCRLYNSYNSYNSSVSISYKKPSYRWGTARRGRASWNLVKFCTNVDDLYLKRSETRLLPIRL